MPNEIHNLVFEGGGVKGLAYAGALEALAEKNVLEGIRRVGGASAGAIGALLVGLNYSPREVGEILNELDFKSFMDGCGGWPGDVWRLFKRYGYYKGDACLNWMRRRVADKTGHSDCTFAQVQAMKAEKGFRDLYFVGTNLSTGSSEVFSHETTPDMPLAEAARISMSIPLFFTARRGAQGQIYVDGGVLRNFPVRLFDHGRYFGPDQPDKEMINPHTLGFRLDSEKEIKMFTGGKADVRYRIRSIFSYSKALAKTIMEFQDAVHLSSDDWKRTIYIDTLGVKTTEFDISEEMKKNLVDSGRAGVGKYFEWLQK